MRNYLFLVGLMLFAASCGSPENTTNGKRQTGNGELRGKEVCISDSSRQAGSVYLTSDGNNNPVMCWCETDSSEQKFFYLSFYNNAAAKFSAPINIPIQQNASIHEEGMPKVAFKDDGTIIAVYETSAPTAKNNYAGQVLYIVSIDNGKTWTSPVSVHADTSAGTSHSFAVTTRLSDGEVGACWLDESFDQKVGGRPVKFAKTNQENRFTNELIIDSIACQCCRIAMSSSVKGSISVAFRDIVNDSIRDISLSTSNDNGKTFTPAFPFSNDGWAINGCPHNGPSIAEGGNTIYAAWFTGGRQKGVYYCELNEKKEAINKQLVSDQGRFIQLTLMPDNSRVLAYNENVHDGDKVYSNIVLNKIEQGKVFSCAVNTGKTMASYPVVRSYGSKTIIVAWKSDERVYYAVKDVEGITTEITRPSIKDLPLATEFSHVQLAASNDPVCGMPLSLSPADTTLFKGGVYGFCSETCKGKFILNPVAFVK